ncbi:MAG: helix-turn-helix transcriptional regulator [Chloroflexota bacterium]
MTYTVLERNGSVPGSQARIRRVARLLTREELAETAGVTADDVASLEGDQPLAPEVIRRVLSQLGITS